MAVKLLAVILCGLVGSTNEVARARRTGFNELPDRPRCLPDVGDRCVQGDYTVDEYYYTVNGLRHLISFSEGGFFTATCKAAPLGDFALPCFKRIKRFNRVTLEGCVPPANGSYADALRALNITVFESLHLKKLPSDTHLTGVSFVGFPSLKALELRAETGVIELEAGVLAPLRSLRELTLDAVRPSALPRLHELRMRNTGIRSLPPEALEVYMLEVVEENMTEIGALAPRLEVLTLDAPIRSLPRAPALRQASISRWQDAAPGPLAGCERLELLLLLNAAARRLPAGFVAACPYLDTLELQLMKADEIPEGFLRNASALKTFKAAFWPLKKLPADLFEYSPELKDIDLSNNNLTELPSSLFAPVVGSLRRLVLARNRLRAAAALAVRPLSGLRVLNLSHNALGDLCPATSDLVLTTRLTSFLSGMKQLEQLVLSRARVPRLCADWVHHMPALRRLDLTNNSITELQFDDLKFQRNVSPADVDLSGNPLRVVRCSRDDYVQAQRDSIPLHTVKVILDSRLECSCTEYYLALALRERRVPALFEPRCAAVPDTRDLLAMPIQNVPLREVPLELLVCELPDSQCAANCSCVREPERGLSVSCAGLAALPPRLSAAPDPVRRVRAAGLRRLPAALPPTLELLDLSDGLISSATPEEAAALFAHGTRVRLARNPLRCACDQRDLLDALRANRRLVLDYANVTCCVRFEERRCAESRALGEALAALACPARGSWALGALLALGCAALAAVLLAALVARPETRLRIKALLHSRGVRARWLARRLEPADEERAFDAFVAHAAADRRLVAETLAPRLEAAGLRLCLEYRDWPAGAWIPAQIEASVRFSRRTLALVTPAFVRSRWARAQLRAAHAAALRERSPRVLLLLAARPAELDDELRALLAAHAALRWGEPLFWEKLRYALPDPRPPNWRPAPLPAPPAAAAADPDGPVGDHL